MDPIDEVSADRFGKGGESIDEVSVGRIENASEEIVGGGSESCSKLLENDVGSSGFFGSKGGFLGCETGFLGRFCDRSVLFSA
jgi:hypothetical protein